MVQQMASVAGKLMVWPLRLKQVGEGNLTAMGSASN